MAGINRYKQREQAFILIFESLFNDNEDIVSLYEENIGEVGDYAKELFFGINNRLDELDNIISEFSTGWKISRISKVNISILRLAVFEMAFVEDVPDGVAINEAVELAKKFSTKEDAAFVNGILGSYSRSKD